MFSPALSRVQIVCAFLALTAVASSAAPLPSHARGVALVSGDFDGDGLPDVAAGYAVGSGGAIVIHRGNAGAIYPIASLSRAPFHDAGTPVEVPVVPELLAAGDFDADGHLDVAFGRAGEGAVTMLPGRGSAAFDAPRTVALPGRLAAMTALQANAEITRTTADRVAPMQLGEDVAAVMSMRLNRDATPDRVLLYRDHRPPSVILSDAGTIYTVTNTNPWGPGSLMDAMAAAYGQAGPSTIEFDIPVNGQTTFEIHLQFELPWVNDTITIDGMSQPGWAGTPVIVLDGTNAGFLPSGVVTAFAQNCVVRGLTISGFAHGIQAGPGTIVEGNHILGTSSSGILSGFGAVQIGGSVPEARNVIGGMFQAVYLYHAGPTGSVVEGNYIGVDPTGMTSIPNTGYLAISGEEGDVVRNNVIIGTDPWTAAHVILQRGGHHRVEGNMIGVVADGSGTGSAVSQTWAPGVLLYQTDDVILGGSTPLARNVIGGTGGIRIEESSGIIVQGNYVGTNAAGTAAVPNRAGVAVQGSTNNAIIANILSGNHNGVSIESGVDNRIEGNWIGVAADGVTALPNTSSGVVVNSGPNVVGADNVIAWNRGSGVAVAYGSAGVTIRGNSIHHNAGPGISGAPAIQPYMDVSTTGAGLHVDGGLWSPFPNASYWIDLYTNRECDPSGFGEAETPAATVRVTTDVYGFAPLSLDLVAPPGSFVTGTATDAGGTTSTISYCFAPIITNQPPVALCRGVNLEADAACSATATAAVIDNGSYDPDADPLVMTLAPAGPFALGMTPVTLDVSDGRGGSASCDATVTVIDVTPPSMTCPSDITVQLDFAQSAAVVNYAPASATDNCGVITACDVPSGAEFGAGTTTVTCTATDLGGNTSACSFVVTLLTPAAATEDLIGDVEALVAQGSIAPGNASALNATLRAALAKLAQGNGAAAAGLLRAFIEQVQAIVRAGRISAADGNALIASAQSILSHVS